MMHLSLYVKKKRGLWEVTILSTPLNEELFHIVTPLEETARQATEAFINSWTVTETLCIQCHDVFGVTDHINRGLEH